MIEQARTIAREESVYLQPGLQPILHSQQFPFAENRAVLIDPSGTVVWDYHKAHPIPFVKSPDYDGGPEIAPYTDTPYGRIAGVICYDTDYVPYIKYDHTHVPAYRALENGFSMMRPDAKGISLAVDPFGRELASGDYYTADQLDVVAMMPIQTVPTVYSRIGDVFAWLGMVALVGLAIRANVGRRTTMSLSGSQPVEAPIPVG